MANENSAATTSSLDSFELDSAEDWFNIGSGTQASPSLIDKVKNQDLAEFDVEVEDNEAPTKLEEENKKKPKVEPEVTSTTKESVVKKKAEVKKEETTDPEEIEEVEEHKFFQNPEDETKEEDEEEDKTKKPAAKKEAVKDSPRETKKEATVDDAKFFTTLASEMKERGVLSIDVPEDTDITEDEFFDLQDKEIETRVDETFQAFYEGLEPMAVDFIKFMRNKGGSALDFINQYATPFTLETLDEENPEQREKVIKHYLATIEKMESEELQERLEFIKESGKEKALAAKYFEKIQKSKEAERKALLENAATAKKDAEENAKKFVTDLVDTASKTESFGMFPISKTDQKELPAYITKASIKVGPDRYIPPFNNDLSRILRASTPEDKQALLALAKIVKNRFKLQDLEIKTETKVIKETKSKLKAARQSASPHSSGGGIRTLSDYFE